MTGTPYLRTQDRIVADLKRLMRDNEDRWDEEEYTAVLNLALYSTWERVLLEQVYTISGGWVSGTYEYDLPSYIQEPIRPQVLRGSVYPDLQLDNTTTTWIDLPGYMVVPDGSGGLSIKVTGIPYTLDAQVLWWVRNGGVPWPIPALSGTITSSATTLILDRAPLEIGDSGWVKINEEWIFYAGVTRGASTTTLSNLLRGEYSTTAAAHTLGDTVYFGAFVDRPDVWRCLYDQAMAHLHEFYLTDASGRERDHHERQVTFYQKRVDDFWNRLYTPSFTGQFVFQARGFGAVS